MPTDCVSIDEPTDWPPTILKTHGFGSGAVPSADGGSPGELAAPADSNLKLKGMMTLPARRKAAASWSSGVDRVRRSLIAATCAAAPLTGARSVNVLRISGDKVTSDILLPDMRRSRVPRTFYRKSIRLAIRFCIRARWAGGG